jgi:hypothetical protein
VNEMMTSVQKDTELVKGTKISDPVSSTVELILLRLSLHSLNFVWATFKELKDVCKISISYKQTQKQVDWIAGESRNFFDKHS